MRTYIIFLVFYFIVFAPLALIIAAYFQSRYFVRRRTRRGEKCEINRYWIIKIKLIAIFKREKACLQQISRVLCARDWVWSHSRSKISFTTMLRCIVWSAMGEWLNTFRRNTTIIVKLNWGKAKCVIKFGLYGGWSLITKNISSSPLFAVHCLWMCWAQSWRPDWFRSGTSQISCSSTRCWAHRFTSTADRTCSRSNRRNGSLIGKRRKDMSKFTGLIGHSPLSICSILGSALFSLGSVLVWAIIRSSIPRNTALATIVGLASGYAIARFGYDYLNHVDSLSGGKKAINESTA